jgi:acetyl-CoA synthetase
MTIMTKYPNNNIGYLCSDLQVELGRGNRVAFRWISNTKETQDFTYGDLKNSSNRAANILRGNGLQTGDSVMFLLPRIPELFFLFLGAMKLGANSCILFTSIGEETLKDRIMETETHLLVTNTKLLYKIENLFADSPYALKLLVVDENTIKENRIGILNDFATADSNFTIPYTAVDQNSHFHFTSGSTGKPKGVQHVHGGAINHLNSFLEVMQPNKDDIYWCTADPGWVTGTTYGIIAPWMYGLTEIQFEGNFNSSAWMQIIENHKVNILYSAPTAFRMLMQNEDALFSQFDLSKLKRIYCVGEPLNPVIIEWGRKVLKKDIYDTWFQTETGSIMIANRPGLDIRPGSMGKPLSYINAQILDKNGKPNAENQEGLLCIQKPWASMFSTYIKNPDVYKKKFFGEYYSSGDIAYKDNDGYIWFVGRNDDIINTAGHLVSPFEVESALLEIPEIIDVGVVGAPDDVLFEKVVAFIVLRGGLQMTPALDLKIKLHISKEVSSMASPREIINVTKIPKTKSGKIMRRLLKNQYLNLELGDTSTLEED